MAKIGKIACALLTAAFLVGFLMPFSASARPPVRAPQLFTVYRSSVAATGHGHFRYTLAAAVTTSRHAKVHAVSSFSNTPANTPNGNWSDCETDGSVSVEDCVQFDYATYTCGSAHCGTINDIYLTYYNLDPHDATLVQRRWIEGASGRCDSGCAGYTQGTITYPWKSVSSGTTYHYTGHWAGTYTMLDKAAGAQRGGTSRLDWDYRGTSHQLVINPALNDNGDGGSER